jgi:hypothetical protein
MMNLMLKSKNRENYLVNDKGERLGVIIDIKTYMRMMEDLEEPESIRAFDRARASGDKAVPFQNSRNRFTTTSAP